VNGGLRNKRRLISMEEDLNPLEGAINIVDAMLVFACGLMLALVIRWNVDLAQFGDRVNITRGQEVSQDADVRNDLLESQGPGQLYEKMGTVYKDPVSGELFLLTNE